MRSYQTAEAQIRIVGILRNEPESSPRSPGAEIRTRSAAGETTERPSRDDTAHLGALRSGLERFRKEHPGHPIERSLGLLLTTLESDDANGDPSTMERMISATERMTRIVEQAMVHAQDPSSGFRWYETSKFVDRLTLQYSTAIDRGDVDLEIDWTDAPPLIWGDESILNAAIGGLLDWMRERSAAPTRIQVRIEAGEESMNPERWIQLSLSCSASDNETTQDGPREATLEPAHLSLATAIEAVAALDGELILPSSSASTDGGELARIVIPQRRRAD